MRIQKTMEGIQGVAECLLGQKKVVMIPEIGQEIFFLSTTRPHKSNVYENIYFLFQKNTHTQTKKFQLANLFEQIYFFSFSFFSFCFSTKKNTVRLIFYLKILFEKII